MIVGDAAQSWIDIATQSGPVAGLLAIVIYGGFKRQPWWVFGWVYRDLEKRYERRGEQLDRWWEIAMRSATTAQTLAEEPPARHRRETDA